GIDLEVKEGEWVTIMGPSGSGKTTLLNLISCLDRPSSGKLEVLGQDPGSLSDMQLTIFRRNNLGMIFQQYHLIPYLSALENVEIAQYFHSMVDRESARETLVRLGLSERLNHIPAKLSGGEQQRVSVARALINDPKIILADEPTGNLDRKNGLRIMEILKGLHDSGQTIILVTHDPDMPKWGDRTIFLSDGHVMEHT
ncbi:MAG: ABC transporter ATP-binding protein, partial [Thermoplasmatota archaeon]